MAIIMTTSLRINAGMGMRMSITMSMRMTLNMATRMNTTREHNAPPWGTRATTQRQHTSIQ
eukprot:8108487-Lingulodinium_polyedra.AAC.1